MQFSVSISVYGKDNPHYFDQALESVFQQTVTPTEVVLVVDGPVPESISQIIQTRQACHENLKVIPLAQNVGHGLARSQGLKHCSYELVAIMDSDDICVPDRFERQLKCFQDDEDLSIVGGYIWEFEDTIDNVVGVRKVPTEDADIKRFLKSRCPLPTAAVMFRKSHIMRAGGFLDWYCNEDYYLWIRMCLAGCKCKNLPVNLVFVRVNQDSYIRRGGLRYFRSEAALQLYMYRNNVIGAFRLSFNIAVRVFVQLLIPSRLRKWMFIHLFRSKKE